MKPSAAVSVAVLIVCAFMLACGAGSNRPAPILVSVMGTQNPLVAQVQVGADCPGQAMVEFGPDTSYGRSTGWNALPGFFGKISIIVAGMKASTTYHLRAQVQCLAGTGFSDDMTFTTGPLPSVALPTIKVTRPTQSLKPSSGVEVLNLVGPPNMLLASVTDIDGNIIWYYNPGNGASPTPMKLMQNGHFILNVGDLREVDLAGSLIRSITVAEVNQSLQAQGYSFTIPPSLGLPGGGQFHHDVLVLPNGHWIALCQIAKSFTDLSGFPGTTEVVGDALVDIDLNGNVVWAWSAFDHLDVNRHLFGLPDWTHSNAILYSPDGSLLLSMRGQSWIVKIDYANGTGAGDILWRLGNGGDFTLAGGDDSNWFYAQHYPNLETANGSLLTLAIVDNGDFRVQPGGGVCSSTCFTRATLFQVDEATRAATLLWQDLPGFYSFWGGSIGILGNGDMEFDLSTVASTPASQVMEVTQTGNPQTVWQMNIAGANAYRAFRIPSLYPGVSWQK